MQSSLQREQCYTASIASLLNSKHQKFPAKGMQCKKSSMHFDTNSSLWLMVDITVVTVTLEWLCIVKLLCHLLSFIPFHKLIQQHWPCREIKQLYFTKICKRTLDDQTQRKIISEHQHLVVLTGSIFIIVTEVKVNCSAEFKNVTPLVLIDNFVFWLLLKARNGSY